MKKILVILSLCLSTVCSLPAQEWLTDIDTAKEISIKEHKPIILVFQGSDWCAPCMKLEREIWSTEEFKEYAKGTYVLLKADFPRKRKNLLPADQQAKNNQLAEKYNTDGFFPLVVVLDQNGEVLGKTGYEKVAPKAFIEILNSFL